MALGATLHRMLSHPTTRERDILQSKICDLEMDHAFADQQVDINRLTEEFDTKIIKIHKNTNQRLIVVTQDKAILTLKRNLSLLGKKEWIAPLSTVTTILLALITSNFKPALGLGAAEWRAMFIVAGFITAGWLGKTLWHGLHAKTFQDVIKDVVYELGARNRGTETPTNNTRSRSTTIAACKAKKPTRRVRRRR